MKQCFTDIRDVLLLIPNIKAVRRWNNQLANGSIDLVSIMPAVFISLRFDWTHTLLQSRVGTVTATIRIATNMIELDTELTDDSLQSFDYAEAIFLKMQQLGFAPTSDICDENYTSEHLHTSVFRMNNFTEILTNSPAPDNIIRTVSLVAPTEIVSQ